MLLPGRIWGLMLRLQDLQPDNFLFKESLSVRQGPTLFNEHEIVSQPRRHRNKRVHILKIHIGWQFLTHIEPYAKELINGVH